MNRVGLFPTTSLYSHIHSLKEQKAIDHKLQIRLRFEPCILLQWQKGRSYKYSD